MTVAMTSKGKYSRQILRLCDTDVTEIQSTLTKSYFNIMEMKSEHYFFYL